MAYCPQCGREQRCGCEECHECGVRLVECAPNSGLPDLKAPGKAGRRQAHLPDEPRAPEAAGARRSPNWLAHVFLILGTGILLVTVIEMINTAKHFPAVGAFVSPGQGVKSIGYYLGVLLYTSSVRLLTGFALFAAGLLTGRTSVTGEAWDRSLRATGLAMGGISVLYVIDAAVLALPITAAPFVLRAMLPPLWAAVPILLVTGAALAGAGYLMASRLSSGRERLSFWPSRREDEGGKRSDAAAAGGPAPAGTTAGPVKAYGIQQQGGED